jgi:hypothetical protein
MDNNITPLVWTPPIILSLFSFFLNFIFFFSHTAEQNASSRQRGELHRRARDPPAAGKL